MPTLRVMRSVSSIYQDAVILSAMILTSAAWVTRRVFEDLIGVDG